MEPVGAAPRAQGTRDADGDPRGGRHASVRAFGLHHGLVAAVSRQEEAFIAAWEEFAGWAVGSMEPVLRSWPETCARRAAARELPPDGTTWRRCAVGRGIQFKERMSRVQNFVDKFAPTELEVVARQQGEG